MDCASGFQPDEKSLSLLLRTRKENTVVKKIGMLFFVATVLSGCYGGVNITPVGATYIPGPTYYSPGPVIVGRYNSCNINPCNPYYRGRGYYFNRSGVIVY